MIISQYKIQISRNFWARNRIRLTVTAKVLTNKKSVSADKLLQSFEQASYYISLKSLRFARRRVALRSWMMIV